MFFDTWAALVRVFVIAPLAYLALVLLLRISGKRTLTKLNAFDLVITVALGSTLATIVLSKSVSLAEGILALMLLVGLQYAITWSSVRSGRVQHLIKSEPTLLVSHGRFLEGAMRRQRVTQEEILSVLRGSGEPEVEPVAAVVLETDGTFSVLSELPRSGKNTLRDVKRAQNEP